MTDDQGSRGPSEREASSTAQTDGGLELSIVMPFYNPGPSFASNVGDVISALEATGLTYEVVTVSDGSTDGSAEVAAALDLAGLRHIELPSNVGKGEALRVGLRECRGKYLGFIDADGDIPANLLGAFVQAIRTEAVDIVVGSKRHRDSDVVYPPLRRMYSWGYQQLVHVLFHLRVRDTQTGLKILRRGVLESVLPCMFEKRFAFDLELLVVAAQQGFDRVEELPVRIERKLGSTISPRAVLGILVDTIAIWWRLRVRHMYSKDCPDAL